MGIAILWASGVEFPIYPPPGILILLAGAIFVGLATWPWAPGVGAFLGLFVLVGFLISPTGLSNLSGEAGTSVAVGQGIQVVGAHRPDRRGDRHTGQRSEAGSPSALRPCGGSVLVGRDDRPSGGAGRHCCIWPKGSAGE